MHDVTSTLREILADHGVETVLEKDGWLSTCGSYPACRAYTDSPRPADDGYKLRLDVEIALSPVRVILESFSDSGPDPTTAFRSSLQHFCTGSLHVLLSALWQVVNPDQVLIEDCACNQDMWTIHIGNIVRKAAHGSDVSHPHDLITAFDNLIQTTDFPPTVHWGRVYFANMPKSEPIVEVLLDNEPWTKGEIAIRGASWPALDLFYSSRMFWMLVPKSEAA